MAPLQCNGPFTMQWPLNNAMAPLQCNGPFTMLSAAVQIQNEISQQGTAFLCKNDSCMVLAASTHHLGEKKQLIVALTRQTRRPNGSAG